MLNALISILSGTDNYCVDIDIFWPNSHENQLLETEKQQCEKLEVKIDLGIVTAETISIPEI